MMQKVKSVIGNHPPSYRLKPIFGDKRQEVFQRSGFKSSAPQQVPLKFISKEPIVSRKALTRFLIHTRDEIKVILFDEIVCCIADSNYTFIHLQDGSKVMVSKTLKEVNSILFPPNFFRAHASHLVNLFFIKRILKSNQFRVELLNNITLDVSRSRRDELMLKMESL